MRRANLSKLEPTNTVGPAPTRHETLLCIDIVYESHIFKTDDVGILDREERHIERGIKEAIWERVEDPSLNKKEAIWEQERWTPFPKRGTVPSRLVTLPTPRSCHSSDEVR